MIEHDHEGQSVAAWTAVTIMIIGSFVILLGFLFPSMALIIVGSVIFLIVGPLAGKGLAAAGYGVDGKKGSA